MARRGRPVAVVTLTDEERETLTRWARRAESSQALAQRCRIVLGCADGKLTELRHQVGGPVAYEPDDYLLQHKVDQRPEPTRGRNSWTSSTPEWSRGMRKTRWSVGPP
ncbi:hypothetical protein ACIQMJ_08500 [Actinosynnema sp. NPDC091369]